VKSIPELKEILANHDTGPIVKMAAKDLLKWCEAYREVAIGASALDDYGNRRSLEKVTSEVDEEARKIAEGK